MPRHLALALAALPLATACGAAETGTSPTPIPAATGAAEPEAAAAEAEAAAAAGPSGGAAEFASSDGKVRAPRPAGDGWECEERVASAPDPETTLIKCRHSDRGRFFFMMAKDYAVPSEQVRSPETIVREVLPKTYTKLYERFSTTREEPVIFRGVAGVDTWIEAHHAKAGAIRKRERVLTRGEHVFIISAEGTPAVFDAESAAIDAWFAGVGLRNLDGPAAP